MKGTTSFERINCRGYAREGRCPALDRDGREE
jgi:hypothetical protein